jgi:hypothetical protein
MSPLQPGRIQPQATEERPEAHQSSEIFVPGLVAFLIFMAFSAFVMHAGLWGWLKGLRGKVAVDTAEHFHFEANSRTAAKFPTLQVKPQLDWDAYRQKQSDLLNHYGWIDKTEGIVRVPISMAIDRMLSQGVPHWGPTNRSISPLELQHSRTNGGKR